MVIHVYRLVIGVGILAAVVGLFLIFTSIVYALSNWRDYGRPILIALLAIALSYVIGSTVL